MTERLVDDSLLTLQEAADQLKVHYMTAYRWVRKGDLAAFKAGGRLRVRVSDLRDFIAAREVDVALPSSDPRRTAWATHLDRLHTFMRAGEAVEAGSLVRKVVADGAPAGDVYLHLIAPVLHRIGDDWECGDINVAEEHRATEIAMGLMARLTEHFRRRGPSRGTAVTMTPPVEQHAVAVAMVADFLRATGYDVHHLGANVPIDDLKLFLQVVPTDIVCVSITNGSVSDDVYTRIMESVDGARVFVGGQGVDSERARAAGALVVTDLAHLSARLEHLAPLRPAP